jgi:phosphate transport system substrate-binding protein
VRVTVGISGTGAASRNSAWADCISNASRPIKPTEVELCRRTGSNGEVPVAYDGWRWWSTSEHLGQFITSRSCSGSRLKVRSLERHPPDGLRRRFTSGRADSDYDYFTAAIVGTSTPAGAIHPARTTTCSYRGLRRIGWPCTLAWL